MPIATLMVITSPNTKVPTSTPVTGSNAPSMATITEPTSFTDTATVSNDTMVGTTESPITQMIASTLSVGIG